LQPRAGAGGRHGRTVLDIGGDCLLQRNGILSPDRLDGLDMPVHLVALMEMGDRLTHDRSHPEPDGFDQRQQHEGRPDLVHAAMEREIALDAEFDVAGLVGLVDHVVEGHKTVDAEEIDEVHGPFGGHSLESDPGGDQFVEPVRSDIRHADAPVVEIFKSSVCDQLVERAAHRHSADAKAFRQARNRHRQSRREGAAHEGPADRCQPDHFGYLVRSVQIRV
jgi:hypothetical protein